MSTDRKTDHYREAEALVAELDQWRVGNLNLPGTTAETPLAVQLQAADVQLRLAGLHLDLAATPPAPWPYNPSKRAR